MDTKRHRPGGGCARGGSDTGICAGRLLQPDKTDEDRPVIESIFSHIGISGIEALSAVLADNSNRSARKAAMGALLGLGDLTRDWVNKILDDTDSQWFIKRNALILLESLVKETEDPKRVHKLLRHHNARARDEALNVMVKMGGVGVEGEVIRALEDSDEKVRWRALNALPSLAPLSEDSMSHLLGVIDKDIPEETEAATRQQRKATQFILVDWGRDYQHQTSFTSQLINQSTN